MFPGISAAIPEHSRIDGIMRAIIGAGAACRILMLLGREFIFLILLFFKKSLNLVHCGLNAVFFGEFYYLVFLCRCGESLFKFLIGNDLFIKIL